MALSCGVSTACVCARRPSPDQRPRHVCRAAAYATTGASARQPTRNMVPCFGLVAGLRLRSSRGERARCSGESEVGSARLARLARLGSLGSARTGNTLRRSERASEPVRASRAEPIRFICLDKVWFICMLRLGEGREGACQRERESRQHSAADCRRSYVSDARVTLACRPPKPR